MLASNPATGALKMALKDRQQPASTIDDKINKRLQDRQQKQQARKGAKVGCCSCNIPLGS
jgi:hypothetical protein